MGGGEDKFENTMVKLTLELRYQQVANNLKKKYLNKITLACI